MKRIDQLWIEDRHTYPLLAPRGTAQSSSEAKNRPRLHRELIASSNAAAGLPMATPRMPIDITLPSYETTIGKSL
jgi:hypothetical protein